MRRATAKYLKVFMTSVDTDWKSECVSDISKRFLRLNCKQGQTLHSLIFSAPVGNAINLVVMEHGKHV